MLFKAETEGVFVVTLWVSLSRLASRAKGANCQQQIRSTLPEEILVDRLKGADFTLSEALESIYE